MTRLRCGGISIDHFVAYFVESVPVKKNLIGKYLVKIRMSVVPFFDSQCINSMCYSIDASTFQCCISVGFDIRMGIWPV